MYIKIVNIFEIPRASCLFKNMDFKSVHVSLIKYKSDISVKCGVSLLILSTNEILHSANTVDLLRTF